MSSKLLPVLAAGMALSSCSTSPLVVSRTLSAAEQSPIDGLVYSLPKSMIRIKTKDGLTIIEPVEQVPDPNARYTMEGRHSVMASDTFEFTLTNGLIATATANSIDATPTVVKKVTEAFGGLLRDEERNVAKGGSRSLPNQEFRFDPFAALQQSIGGYTIKVAPLDQSLPERLKSQIRERASCNRSAICVPITTPITVELSAPGMATVKTVLTVVDPTRAIGVNFNRTACAAAANAAIFTDGILTEYNVTRPSEVASCLSIPLDILSAIISAPVDALTGRTKRTNAEKALLAAEISLLTERNKLLAQQQAAASAE